MSGDPFQAQQGKAVAITKWEAVRAFKDQTQLELIGNITFKQSNPKTKIVKPAPKPPVKKVEPQKIEEKEMPQISSKGSNAGSQSTNPYSNYTDEDAEPPQIAQ